MFSDCEINKAIFAVKPENINYLRYLYFENGFDSAIVTYMFGELRIINGNEIVNINIAKVADNESLAIQGDSIEGEDQVLLNYTKSEKFVYSENSELNFFR